MAQFDRKDLKELPEFHGNPRNLPRFISMVERRLNRLVENQRNLFFERLDYKLFGRAYEIYNDNVDGTWESFKVELKRAFLVKKEYVDLSAEMLMMVQFKGEPVIKFADRLNSQLSAIKSAIKDRFADEFSRGIFIDEQRRLALKVFINGLNPMLKTIVKTTRDLTLEGAIDTAVEEEEIFKHEQRSCIEPLKRNHNAQKFCNRCKSSTHQEDFCYASKDIDKVKLDPRTHGKFVYMYKVKDKISRNISSISLSQHLHKKSNNKLNSMSDKFGIKLIKSCRNIRKKRNINTKKYKIRKDQIFRLNQLTRCTKIYNETDEQFKIELE